MACRSGGDPSRMGSAPRRAATSNTASSGEMTQLSHPGSSEVASRTSSSIASVSAARSSGERTGPSRVFASSSDFTGRTIARTPRQPSRAVRYPHGARPTTTARRFPPVPEPWYPAAWLVVIPPAWLLFTWRFEGIEQIPAEGPALIACNHASYLDPIANAYAVVKAGRRPRFLAKQDLFDVRLVGTVLR